MFTPGQESFDELEAAMNEFEEIEKQWSMPYTATAVPTVPELSAAINMTSPIKWISNHLKHTIYYKMKVGPEKLFLFYHGTKDWPNMCLGALHLHFWVYVLWFDGKTTRDLLDPISIS